jgi:hypothetical protein
VKVTIHPALGILLEKDIKAAIECGCGIVCVVAMKGGDNAVNFIVLGAFGDRSRQDVRQIVDVLNVAHDGIDWTVRVKDASRHEKKRDSPGPGS